MLSDNYTPEKYAGNGTTTSFSFGWAIFAEANIRVYLEEITTLVQTLQVLGTDFTIDSGWDNDGGDIVFGSAPSSSYNVIISRDIAETQEVNYKTSSGFRGKIVTNSFDKLTGLVQDAVELASRSLRYPVGTVDTVSREMVAPGVTAGYPYWDGSAYDFIEAITATDDYPGSITRGTDASKSATPAVGDIHVATDTSILYLCFTAGTWTDYNQDIRSNNILRILNIAQTDYTGSLLGVSTTTYVYQSFTPSRDMDISEFSVWLAVNASDVGMTIVRDLNNAPTSTLVFPEVTFACAVGWNSTSLGVTVKLDAGTRYWIRLTSKTGGNTPNFRKSGTDVIVGEVSMGPTGTRYDEDLAFKLGTTTFAVGDAIKVVGTSFGKAQADTEANSESFIGIVSSVSTVNYYTLTDIILSGICDEQSSLVEGELYYLDPATAGAFTATKPTTLGTFVKPVLIALSETSGIVINQVGAEVESDIDDIVFTANQAVSYENEVVYNQ